MSIRCGLVSVLLACAAGAAAPAAGTPATVSAEVTTAMPGRESFGETVTGYGSIEADPRQRLTLSLPVAGRIEDLQVAAGQRVKAGQALLRLRVSPAGRLAYAQARHEVDLARAVLGQTRMLFWERLATQAQIDTARKTLADAEANLASQRTLGTDRAITALKAPVAGVVESVAVASGQRIAADTPLLQLAPTQARTARIGVEPGTAARLKTGQRATLVPAFGGDALQGSVVRIADSVNPQTRLVEVLIDLPTGAGLPLGSEVEARIDSGQIQAWAVPRGAVLNDARGAYLFQVDHGVAHLVDVKLVQPDGDIVGVDGPLNPELPVVVLGSYELSDGMHVRIGGPPSSQTPATSR